MDNKGQNFTVAALIILFISVLIGLVLLPTISQYVGSVTDTYAFNSSAGSGQVTFPADGATIDLEGQEIIGSVLAWNTTQDLKIVAANYTISEGVSATTGLKSIQLTAVGSEYDGVLVNVSYEYGPDGYIDSAGGRSIAGLITLFFALAIAIIAMTPAFRNKLFDLVGR